MRHNYAFPSTTLTSASVNPYNSYTRRSILPSAAGSISRCRDSFSCGNRGLRLCNSSIRSTSETSLSCHAVLGAFMLLTSVQHFFKYAQGIFNSIFCLNLLPKFDGFLSHLRVTNAKANGFPQTLNSQILISNRFGTYS